MQGGGINALASRRPGESYMWASVGNLWGASSGSMVHHLRGLQGLGWHIHNLGAATDLMICLGSDGIFGPAMRSVRRCTDVQYWQPPHCNLSFAVGVQSQSLPVKRCLHSTTCSKRRDYWAIQMSFSGHEKFLHGLQSPVRSLTIGGYNSRYVARRDLSFVGKVAPVTWTCKMGTTKCHRPALRDTLPYFWLIITTRMIWNSIDHKVWQVCALLLGDIVSIFPPGKYIICVTSCSSRLYNTTPNTPTGPLSVSVQAGQVIQRRLGHTHILFLPVGAGLL